VEERLSGCDDVQWEKRIKTKRARGGWCEWRVVVSGSGGGVSGEKQEREGHEKGEEG
jgi:hypothetical protein